MRIKMYQIFLLASLCMIPLFASEVHTASEGELLIVVDEAYWGNAKLDAFAEWKHKSGIKTKMVKAQDITAGPESQVDDLKNYFQNAYDNWSLNLSFIFIVSDLPAVPSITGPFPQPFNASHQIDQDAGYALLDGDDNYLDVCIGRVTPKSSVELENVLDKIMTHEQNPGAVERIYFNAAEEVVDGFEEDFHQISCDMEYVGYEVFKYYQLWEDVSPMPANTHENLVDGISANPLLFTDYSHGIAARWSIRGSHFYAADADRCINTVYPVTGIWTCLGSNYKSTENCINESFVKAKAGGLATLGYVISCSANTALDVFKEFSEKWIAEEYDYLGQFHMETAKANGNPSNSWAGGHYLTYILFGDPSLRLRYGPAAELAVTHEPITDTQAQTYAVHVEKDGLNLSGATVCLWKENDLHEVGFSDADGDVEFTIDPDETGKMYVTVVGKDLIPYRGESHVVEDLTVANVIAVAVDSEGVESGSEPASIQITRGGPTNSAVEVFYAVSGTADSSDYSETLNGTLTIPAGETQVTQYITPVDDLIPEPTETVVLTLQSNVHYTIVNSASATVSILDNEAAVVLQYSEDGFTESDSDDGSIQNSIVVSLTNEAFSADVVSGGYVSATGVPDGLSAEFVRNSSTQLTMTLTGNATAHTSMDDVNDLRVVFTDNAFDLYGNAAAVQNADTFLCVDFATTLIVLNENDSGADSLRDRLLQADAGDVIVFDDVVSLITLLSEIEVTKDITIDGGGDVTLSGNDICRVFDVGDYISVDLRNLTLSNGRAATENANAYGGAIYNEGDLTLFNVTVENSTATATLSVSKNITACGGAIYSKLGTLTLNSCVLSNNTATGVDNYSDVSGKRAFGYGGAIYLADKDLIINNSTLCANSATSEENGSDSPGFADGGAIYSVSVDTVTIKNSTFSGNGCDDQGGGIYVKNTSNMNVYNSTLTENSAESGEAAGIQVVSPAYVYLHSTLISGNITGKDIESNADTELDHCLLGTGSTGISLKTDCPPETDVPMLGTLADNGGAVKTHALLSGSPAIDAGFNPEALTTDQRGAGYSRTIGFQTDIGAVEKQNIPIQFVWMPTNLAVNVSVSGDLTITLNQPIRNLDDSEITDANLTQMIDLKETDALGADVAFSATINTEKTFITIDPSADLQKGQLYYVAIQPVENAWDMASALETNRFTTLADGYFVLDVIDGTGGGTYTSGTAVAVSATLPVGHHFVSWTGGTTAAFSGGDRSASDTTYTIGSSNETIRANTTNEAPSISAIADSETNEDFSKTVAFTISDAETDPDSLSLSARSSNNLLIPTGSITFSGTGSNRSVLLTPVTNVFGVTDITLTLVDASGLEDVETFRLTVHPVDDAPIVTGSIPDQEGYADQAFLYSFPETTFTDPEGAALTYTASQSNGSPLPAWLNFEETAARTFSGTPAESDVGVLSIKVTANDNGTNGLTVSSSFDLEVFSDAALLTMASTGDGTTTPASGTTTNIQTATPFPITATANDGSFFDRWNSSDNLSIEEYLASSTTVTLEDAATATAVFKEGPAFSQYKMIGSVEFDKGVGCALDSDGNLYLIGFFEEPIDFGGGHSLTPVGGFDVFFVKYNSMGTIQWLKRIGGDSYDFGYGIAVSENDTVYITGSFYGNNIDFGDGNLLSSAGSGNDSSTFVAGYNPEGDCQMALAVNGELKVEDLAADDAENIYLAGVLKESSLTLGSIELTRTGKQDIFIAKYNTSSEAWVWAKQKGSSGTYSKGLGVDVDQTGNVYLTGDLSGDRIYIEKRDSAGVEQWSFAAASEGVHDNEGTDVAVDSSGNVYVVGTFSRGVNFNNDVALTSTGGSDLFLVKYNATGMCQWGENIGGDEDDSGNGLGLDDGSGVYVTGSFQSSMMVGATSLSCVGGKDVFVAKYNSSGDKQWAKRAGGGFTDDVFSIAVDENGSVSITGYSYGAMYFDGLTDEYNASYDFYFAKILGADFSAPQWASAFPIADQITQTTCELLTKANEAGTVYCVVVPNGADSPSSEQVKAGQNAAGESVLSCCAASWALSLSVTTNEITGLEPETLYDVYLVAEDDEDTPNLQTEPTKMTIRTIGAPNNPPTVANPISDISVVENADNTEIDLTSVFTDTDNEDALITKAVWSNSNPLLVSASMNTNTLTLDYQTDQTGTATLVIRATSNGQTVDDTFTVEVTDPDALPWTETFDDLNIGGLFGQHGWTADEGAIVQTGTVHVGSRALSLQSATASHTFTEAQASVVIEFHAKFVRGAVTPSDVGTAVAIFSIDTNGYLVAYSNTTPITLTSTNLSDDWHSFKAQLDYTNQTWNMTVDGALLVDRFAFYSTQSDFTKIAFKSGSQAAFIDEIRVANHSSDTDGDGIPDTWENTYYGGETNAIATNLCANGINTVLQAYIAGLNPTNANETFKLGVFGNVLQWSNVSERVYTIYWTSNLLDGFGAPWKSNITSGVFTDTFHEAESESFYKLEVELE